MKYMTELSGIPGTTTRVAATDVSQALADAILYSGGEPAIGAMISCEDQNLRYAFNTAPTQGANGLGHILYVGQTLTLDGGALVNAFRFINHTNASDAVIQVTPFYESGV